MNPFETKKNSFCPPPGGATIPMVRSTMPARTATTGVVPQVVRRMR
ncbi:MAG: hypothetical protein LBI15_05675 [Dysgonamonadaceae bacterium]|nr:hypothetical protein [Dysgonamonadaceae bacterium]